MRNTSGYTITDTTSPEIINVTVIDSVTLQITLSEPPDTLSIHQAMIFTGR